LIRLLRTEFPQSALMWIEVAWRVRGSYGHPPYHVDAAFAHERILQYYDIAQLSMLRVLGPFDDIKRARWIEKNYYCDAYHPNKDGAKLIASMVAQFLFNAVEVAKNTHLSLPFLRPTPDATWLPTPMILSLADISVLHSKPVLDLTLTDNKVVKRYVKKKTNSWSFATDLARKPKTLMTTTIGCATLNLGTFPRPVKAISLEWLFSYEGFGKANVTLLTNTTIMTMETECWWDSHTSQLQMLRYEVGSKPEQNLKLPKYLRVCSIPGGHANATKLKLFSAQIFLA